MSIIYTQLDGDRKCNIAAYGYFVNTFNNIFEVDYGSTPTAKVDIILNLYSSAHAAYFPNPATLQGGTIPARAGVKIQNTTKARKESTNGKGRLRTITLLFCKKNCNS